MVICLERGADLHMAQLMPLPLTVSCRLVFTVLVPAHAGSPGQRAIKRVCAISGLFHFSRSELVTVISTERDSNEAESDC